MNAKDQFESVGIKPIICSILVICLEVPGRFFDKWDLTAFDFVSLNQITVFVSCNESCNYFCKTMIKKEMTNAGKFREENRKTLTIKTLLLSVYSLAQMVHATKFHRILSTVHKPWFF